MSQNLLPKLKCAELSCLMVIWLNRTNYTLELPWPTCDIQPLKYCNSTKNRLNLWKKFIIWPSTWRFDKNMVLETNWVGHGCIRWCIQQETWPVLKSLTHTITQIFSFTRCVTLHFLLYSGPRFLQYFVKLSPIIVSKFLLSHQISPNHSPQKSSEMWFQCKLNSMEKIGISN